MQTQTHTRKNKGKSKLAASVPRTCSAVLAAKDHNNEAERARGSAHRGSGRYLNQQHDLCSLVQPEPQLTEKPLFTPPALLTFQQARKSFREADYH